MRKCVDFWGKCWVLLRGPCICLVFADEWCWVVWVLSVSYLALPRDYHHPVQTNMTCSDENSQRKHTARPLTNFTYIHGSQVSALSTVRFIYSKASSISRGPLKNNTKFFFSFFLFFFKSFNFKLALKSVRIIGSGQLVEIRSCWARDIITVKTFIAGSVSADWLVV